MGELHRRLGIMCQEERSPLLFVVKHVGDRSLIGCNREVSSSKIVPPVTDCLDDGLGLLLNGGMTDLRAM